MASIEFIFLLVTAVVTPALASNPCVVNFEGNATGFGKFTSTFNNVSYCQYLGVRYAEPPVQKLRFMSPILLHPSGSHNFKQFGSHCFQPVFLKKMINTAGAEDCLFLNVFTPKIANDSKTKYPVLVFIHGGNFLLGSADKYVPGTPDLLVEHGIIVVTLNYRLGVLGFVQSKRFGITGNMGLKDQLTALQWVQQYIANFGGDPQRVTFMGHSEGADSVTYSLYSSNFTGLFQQAIALGGSMLKNTFLNYDPETCSEDLLSRVNANSLEELQQADYQNFSFASPCDKIYLTFVNTVTPCLMPSLEDSEMANPIVTGPPHELVLSRPVNEVPLLVEQTSREYELHAFLEKNGVFLGSHFPKVLDYSTSKRFTKLLEAATVKKYKRGMQYEIDLRFVNIAFQYFPVKHLLDKLVEQNYSQPIYYASFSFDGRFGYTKYHTLKDLITQDVYGPVHGDELGYIFTPHVVKEALENVVKFEKEWKVHKQTVELLANFVKHGNPTPTHSIPGNVIWPAYNDEPKYRLLNISENNVVGSDDCPSIKLYTLWTKFFSCLYYFSCEDLHEEIKRYRSLRRRNFSYIL